VIAILLLTGRATANPVSIEADGGAGVYIYGIIVALCITVEVALLWLLCRVFHDFDGDRVTLGLLAGLNVLTLLFVLTPIIRVTESTLLAEAGVVWAETSGIRAIMARIGIVIKVSRAAIFAGSVNIVSYVIGLLSQ
jgi:hypothetical protein